MNVIDCKRAVLEIDKLADAIARFLVVDLERQVPLFEFRAPANSKEPTKPAIPGLLTTHAEGRYNGLRDG